MVEYDPVLTVIVGVTLILFLIGYALRLLKQPHVVGYILAGILIGPSALNIVRNSEVIESAGNIGVILLLFFIGMHISMPKLFKKWKVAILGTFFQITLTVLIIVMLGTWFDWTLGMSIMLAFVISLSSTAVVTKMLEDWGELNTKVGQNVLSILLVQDVAIIPMLVILEFFGRKTMQPGEIVLTIIGGLLFLQLLVWSLRKDSIKLPFSDHIPNDHEIQVMVALVLCFGMAVLGTMFGLSAGLGAFVAGIVVSSAKQTKWVSHVLESFRVVFVAIFFIYVGLLIELSFVFDNIQLILGLVLLILILNTAMNAAILHFLGDRLQGSVYGGALLSEIGEFSFLVGLVGWQLDIVTATQYQLILALIALSLLISQLWIYVFKKLVGVHGKHVPV